MVSTLELVLIIMQWCWLSTDSYYRP